MNAPSLSYAAKASFEFTNDANDFVTNLKELFPHESNNLDALLEEIKSFNETSLDNPYESAKEKVATFIKDKDMIEMIFCPLLIYGSAWENDMDYSQFVIMFKSIFLEGFARPEGGVRTIIRLLLKKYKDLGGEILYKNGVEKLLINENQMTGVTLESGEELTSSKVLSSVGLPETYKLAQLDNPPPVGKLSFCEIILCYKEKPQDLGIKETIVFYNENEVYEYRKPQDYFDAKSAVVCLPNNFEIDDYDEGMIRLTFMANYEKWMGLSEEDYLAKKDEVLRAGKEVVKKLYPQLDSPEVFSDVFTPKTIEKFTSHFGGTVYGSTEKSRDGKTPVDGLYIIGTDQGFLGIVGAMLSGISMANLHVLMPAESDNNAVL